MTTLTHGGQRLAKALFEQGLLYRTEIGAYLAHPMGRDVRPDLNAAAASLALDAPPAGGDGGLREAQTDRLGRFDHHPDPAIDFCIEVEVIEGLHYDHKVGANDGVELAQRVAKAMTFRVGGDEIAVRAKHTLRGIEAALARPDPREQAAAGVGEALVKADLQIGDGHIEAARHTLHAAMDALTQPNQTPEAAAPSGSVGEDDHPLILEACEPLPSVPTDYVLTCRWPDGSETVECVSEQAAALLGYRGQWIDGTLAAQQPAPQASVADAAGVGEPRPIATAPRDGTPVLGHGSMGWKVVWWIEGDWVYCLTPSFAGWCAPTVWLPLPDALTPPQAARPGDGVHKLSTFSVALDLMKLGDACFRTAWKPGKSIRIVNPDKPALSYLALLYEDGRQAPWTPTRCDLLEDDWTVLGHTPVQADAAEGRS